MRPLLSVYKQYADLQAYEFVELLRGLDSAIYCINNTPQKGPFNFKHLLKNAALLQSWTDATHILAKL